MEHLMELLTKCYACQADIRFPAGKNVVRCEFCSRFNDRPKSEQKETDLMKYANERRERGEFDEAADAYREVLKKNLHEAEARWGLLLCKYGVIYLEDAKTRQRLITCRKACPQSISMEEDFLQACEDASPELREQYQKDAEYIDTIQKEIRRLAVNDEKYDIFICYKETDPETGERTKDSVRAMNLYQRLTKDRYRVFYAPVSLKKHLGANYEAAIFRAIETSRVMLAMGSNPDYFNTTWMQSEWKRFMEKINAGENRLLIPLYEDFPAYKLPAEFNNAFLQGMDMSDVGFLYDLEERLGKIIPKRKPSELSEEECEQTAQMLAGFNLSAEGLLQQASQMVSSQVGAWKIVLRVQQIQKDAQRRRDEEKRRREAEAAKSQQDSENAQLKAELERLRKEAEDARARRLAEEEEKKRKAAEEAQRKKDEENARLKAEVEKLRQQAEAAKAAQEEEARRLAEKAAAQDKQPAELTEEEFDQAARLLASLNLSQEALLEQAGEMVPTKMGALKLVLRVQRLQRETEERRVAEAAQKQKDDETARLKAELERLRRETADAEARKAAEEAAKKAAEEEERKRKAAEEQAAKLKKEKESQDIRDLMDRFRKESAENEKKKLREAEEQRRREKQKDEENARLKAELERLRNEAEKAKQMAVQEKILQEAAELTAPQTSKEKCPVCKAPMEGSECRVCGYVRKDAAQNAQPEPTAQELMEKGARLFMFRGTEEQNAEAIAMLRKAVDMGSDDARQILATRMIMGTGMNKNARAAWDLAKPGAYAGHAGCQYLLGWMCEKGDGVPMNVAEAVDWYKKAVKGGDRDAQYRLGLLYESGNGVGKDPVEALRLYHQSAGNEHGKAMIQLGDCYRNGVGAAKDAGKAEEWYKKAIDKGWTTAMVSLAEMYMEGCGSMKPRPQEAEELYNRAADRGNDEATYRLGQIDEKNKRMLSAQVKYQKAADKGHAGAQHALGKVFAGKGDLAKAAQWYKAASDQEYGPAMLDYAAALEKGQGVSKNASEAAKLRKKAAELKLGTSMEELPAGVKLYMANAEAGNATAQYNLGFVYYYGTGGAHKDLAAAGSWFSRAAEAGLPEAKLMLARMYENGEGLKKNMVKALKYYREAADGGKGLPDAMVRLGELYEQGKGVVANNDQAGTWYTRASEKGSSLGAYRMAQLCEKRGLMSDAEAFCKIAADRGLVEAKERMKKGFADPRADVASLERQADGGNVTAMIELAQKREKEGDNTSATRYWRMAANAGDKEGQYRMGLKYALGTGVPFDPAKAVDLLTESAQQKHSGAMSVLGRMHEEGWCVERNMEKALVWYTMAADAGDVLAGEKIKDVRKALGKKTAEVAEKADETAGFTQEALKLHLDASGGNVEAQYKLGKMFETGNGTPKDLEKAKYWYGEAAKSQATGAAARQTILLATLSLKMLNKASAQEKEPEKKEPEKKAEPQLTPNQVYERGLKLENGDGVAKDMNQAIRCFVEAATRGDGDAQVHLGWLLETGTGIEKSLVKAAEYYRKAAEQGHKIGQCNLGLMYDNGKGVDKDVVEAAKWYRKSAEQGYAKAQFCLGWDYEHGVGVAKNLAEAAKWYQKAADQGNDGAQCNLGLMYENGSGVTKNIAKAVELYKKSAEGGNKYAQCNLGYLYEAGSGVSQNYAEAMKWYRKSADQGHARAQNNLGLMYDNGKGVAKDVVEAAKWYQKAAEQGYANSQFCLGWDYENGVGVAKNLAEAAKWYQKAADQGNAGAQCNLGLMYENGSGVTKNIAKAVELYKKSAEGGNKYAQCNLGYLYETGNGVSQNYAEAMKWYRKSADQGHARAQNNLGSMYDNGKGVAKDVVEAAKWYRKAAEQGYANSQFCLGWDYEKGVGVEKNFAEAVKWYQKAADQGNAGAQCNLGLLYENGNGVAKDMAKAAELYRKSAENGNRYAQCNLGYLYEIGNGVPMDKAEAVKWYRMAANQGQDRGQCNLGFMYEHGLGVAKDYAEAAKWYKKAADQNYARGQRCLAALYEKGLGVQKNASEALRLYNLAAQSGDAEARTAAERLKKEVLEAPTIPPGKMAQEIVSNVNGYMRRKELEEGVKSAERELAGLSRLFNGKRRRELEAEIVRLKNELKALD